MPAKLEIFLDTGTVSNQEKVSASTVYGSDPNPQHGISSNLLLYNKLPSISFLSEDRF